MHDRQTVSLDSLRARRGDDTAGHVFLVLITGAVALAFFMVGAVGIDVVIEAWEILRNRLWDFLASPSSADPTKAGVAQGIRGSILIAAIVMLTFPVGIGAAVYLEEYADDTWLSRLIQVTVRNLAQLLQHGPVAGVNAIEGAHRQHSPWLSTGVAGKL